MQLWYTTVFLVLSCLISASKWAYALVTYFAPRYAAGQHMCSQAEQKHEMWIKILAQAGIDPDAMHRD